MATFTNQTKNAGTFTNETWGTTGSTTIPAYTITGLLGPHTYSEEVTVSGGTLPAFTNQTKS